MDRRSLLRRGLPVVLAGLAGCTGDDGGSGSGDGGSGGSGAGATTDSPTPTRTDAGEPTAPTDPDPGTGTGTGRPTSTPTDTAGSTATPTASPTSTQTAAPTPEPDQRVLVAPGGEFRFEPEAFTVDRGDTVVWVWEGTGHNVSDGATPAGADWSGDDGTTYAAGHTYAYTFEVAGSYEYHCDPHQTRGMVGSFTVE